MQLPENSSVGRSHLIESVKRISARARLVMIGCLPVTELGKTKHYILNTASDGQYSEKQESQHETDKYHSCAHDMYPYLQAWRISTGS